jgi:hypothetical protein
MRVAVGVDHHTSRARLEPDPVVALASRRKAGRCVEQAAIVLLEELLHHVRRRCGECWGRHQGRRCGLEHLTTIADEHQRAPREVPRY